MKELLNVTNRLNTLNKEFQALLQLYTEKHIDLERFKAQNEYIQEEQGKLSQKKLELKVALESKKDTEEQLHAF